MVLTHPHRARTETETEVENRRVGTGEGEGGTDLESADLCTPPCVKQPASGKATV